VIRTLVVDDEQPARERLRQLLTAHADVEVVGDAEDGVQAMDAIAELKPDLILLDIQMPGLSGLEVAASLARPRAAIIFCTAFEQYAVDAFELHAVDYLLKPVNRSRLQAALDRIRETDGARARDGHLDRAMRAMPLTPSRFLARKAGRLRIVGRSEVIAFTFEEGLTRLYTATEQLWMQPTLAALARRLDEQTFCQVSRNAIVSLDAVKEAKPFPDGTGEVILSNQMKLPVTRRRWRALIEQLEQ
jgi:two-component system, LytTR family, response regulator